MANRTNLTTLRVISVFLVVLGLVSNTWADLAGWWKLDEGESSIAYDSAGNNHGTIYGATWVAGVIGDALEFDGLDDYVNIDGYKGVLAVGGVQQPFTIANWFRTTGNGEMVTWGTNAYRQRVSWRLDGGRLRTEHAAGNLRGDTYVNDGEWHHGALVVIEGGNLQNTLLYVDGQQDTAVASSGNPYEITAGVDVRIGMGGPTGGRFFPGAIDDVRIYDEALTEAEIGRVMSGAPHLAWNPNPRDGATDVCPKVVLSWTPGEYADKHDVYFGTNFDDVNDGVGGVTQDPNRYPATGTLSLDFGETYYWRIDEVNAPPDYTIFKGETWQFTTKPIAYPIAGDEITATAFSSKATDEGPENTINGSGLDANDLHSTVTTDMWLSGEESPGQAWIEYEFDKVYKLHEMWVWNHNSLFEDAIGYGLKDVTIEYSENGTDYMTLGTTHEFARAPGAPGYEHNTEVYFGVPAKYVKLTANSNWGGFLNNCGLSEVRFFRIPVRAREPSPEDGTTGVWPDVVLSWIPGRDADTHNLYLSTDEQAVTQGTINPSSIPAADGCRASYGPLSLEMDMTYYWRIDEVEADSVTVHRGEVWSFRTSKVYYVDADAGGANDGSNWANAYNDLQDALTAAWNGDEIRVAQGVYKPAGPAPPPPPPPLSPVITTTSASTGDRAATFQLINGVAIKGGYAGVGEADPNARDIEGYETILSGDLNGDDGPDFANNSENSYHVVTGSGTNGTAVLDGFTIIGGNANGSNPYNRGGGMLNYHGSPTLTNCTFIGNSASYDGGGMYNSESSPTLTNCTFSGNSAEGYAGGGGMYNEENSRPVLTNCTFIGNSAGGEGGGMDNYESSPTLTNCTFSENSAGDNSGGMNNKEHSSPTLTNCTFSGNSAVGWGGGGMVNNDSSPTLTNCVFSDNSAGFEGGGMCNYGSTPTLNDCTFSGNSAEVCGGGMWNEENSYLTLTNCTFSGNSAGDNGGGMSNWDYTNSTMTNCTFSNNSTGSVGGGMANFGGSSPTVTNCTFSGNSARWEGGGVWNNNNSSSTLTNCILWGNTAPSGAQIHNDGTSSATVSYSDVQGGWPGEGNIDADPCFVGLKIGEPPEGAIAHWNFDKGEGTIAHDSAGENDGTVYGAQWTTGQIDGALGFDGVDDYIHVGDSPDFNIETEFAVALWFKANPTQLSPDTLFAVIDKSHRSTESPPYWSGWVMQGTADIYGRLWFGIGNGTSFPGVSTNKNILDDVWHHIAAVFDGTNVKLYLDAVLQGSTVFSGTPVNNTDPLNIGRTRWQWRRNFNGHIDDVRIYDRALSAEEVQQFYQVDYHLLPDSPCINAGDPNYVAEPNETDLDGNPRVIGGRIDMGAYEYANTAPVACIVGGDRIVECGGCWGARVTLDGSCSSDSDSAPGTNDDIASFDWYKADACDPNFEDFLASGEIIDCNLPLGEHIIVLEVIDKAGAFDTNEVTIIVQDTTPPEFTLSVTPTMLWPANHKMVLIRPSWTASDICDDSPEVSLVGITMNEGDEAKGDGHTAGDIQTGDDGSIYLRAERSGSGSGRIYTITYQAVDDSGNVAVASATVTVPHDQR